MTHGTSRRFDGTTARRSGGGSHTPAGTGFFFAARVRALCVVVCCVLMLQPTLAVSVSGRARVMSKTQPAGMLGSSLINLSTKALLAVAAAVTGSMRRLAPAPSYRVNAPGSGYEPEPAALFNLDAPAGITIVSTADTQVELSWPAVVGAVGYKVERSPNVLTPYAIVGQTVGITYQDGGVTRGNSYLYRVQAFDASGALSPPSPVAMATAITFVDSELIGPDDPQHRPLTRVKADHVNDLRLAVAGVRRVALLPAPTWEEEVVSMVTRVRADHMRELRSKLDEARGALGLSTGGYADATLYTGTNGTHIRRLHFEELRTRSTKGSGVTGAGLSTYDDFATARLDQSNRTGSGGVDLYSRNFNWSLPLVTLPGRAGLDLGLALSYNSLVWTKSGNYVLFDGDWGWPAPGFRLGFPIVQGKFYDTQALKVAYLMVTPSGGRVSLRQTAATNVYEAGDSSYLQLTEEQNGSLTLLAPGGARMTYWLLGGAYKCTEVKDSNGNQINATYNVYGNLATVTDTLGRTITFGYYTDGYLKEITQSWQREVEGGAPSNETHRWAKFEYDDVAVRTNFPNTTVFGPTAGQTFHALKKVTLADDTYSVFNYTSWGQVYKVENHAQDNGLLNYIALDLPLDETQTQSDCPRPSSRRDWAAYWNDDDNRVGAASEEAVTGYAVFDGATWPNPENENQQETGRLGQMTLPDGTVYSEYAHSSGWDKSLVRMAEFSSGGTRKKWTSMTWTQDNEALQYQQNPRVRETNVYDANPDGSKRSRRRTELAFTSFGLPEELKEYDSNATTVLRRTHTEYLPESVNAGGAYTLKRIIGLPSKKEVFGRDGTQEKLFSKVTYEYDLGGDLLTAPEGNPTSVVQHDPAYIGTGYTVRGNRSRTRKWDVKDDPSHSIPLETSYNTLGSVVFTRDAGQHKTSISYVDSDGGARLAYPTNVTDPDGFTSSTWFNYDMGVMIKTRTPTPHLAPGQTGVPETTLYYNAAGRVLKSLSGANGAYSKWEYGASGLYVLKYMKVDTDKAETFVVNVTDGSGQSIGVLGEHPGGATGYAASRIDYDRMGRPVRQYSPAEVSVNIYDLADVRSWVPAGEDTRPSGWPHTSAEYDWKGRIRRQVDADEADQYVYYEGCGCAGDEVVTTQEEEVPTFAPPPAPAQGRRTQRTHHDALGRAWKTEVLKWDGTVYSTTTTKYDALDQAVRVRQYAGLAPVPEPEGESGAYQTTLMTYDGFERLKTSKAPTQTNATIYNYNDEDLTQSVVDARGVTKTYGYDDNNRHLVTSITYTTTGNIPEAPPVSFEYDAAGNRRKMQDGSGWTDYLYDTSGHLSSETKNFNGLNGVALPISYQYTLNGQLKKLTDPWGGVVNYGYDKAGQLTGITSTGYGTATDIIKELKYRAWGGLKYVKYGNDKELNVAYNIRLRPESSSLSITGGALNGTPTEDYSYEYYADGRIKQLTEELFLWGNPQGPGADPYVGHYYYDHAGRLTDFYTREPSVSVQWGDNWARHYEHNEWEHLTSHKGVLFGNNADWARKSTFNYTGARMTSINYIFETYPFSENTQSNYDEDGRLLSDGVNTHTFDAAGNLVINHQPHYQSTSIYDGDGLEVSDSGGQLYQLKSGVLGGQTISNVMGYASSLGPAGDPFTRYIYMGGKRVFDLERSGNVPPHSIYVYRWRSDNATGNSIRETDETGTVITAYELDPMGNSYPFLGYSPPEPTPEPTPEEVPDMPNEFSFGSTLDLAGGCMLDGVNTPCNVLDLMIQDGVAVQCRDNYCGPRGFTGPEGNHAWLFVQGDGFALWDFDDTQDKYTFQYLFPGDVEYRDPADPMSWAMFAGGQKQETKGSRGRGRRKRNAPPRTPATPPNGYGDLADYTSNVQIIDAGSDTALAQNKNLLIGRLSYMAASGACNDAFRRANLPTPFDMITNGRIMLAPRRTLTDSSYNNVLGIEESIRLVANKSTAPAQTIGYGYTTTGRAIIIVDGGAFTDLNYLNEMVPHEMIHAAHKYVFKQEGWTGHDLKKYANYDDIIKNCRIN